jgi:hypothetical protein
MKFIYFNIWFSCTLTLISCQQDSTFVEPDEDILLIDDTTSDEHNQNNASISFSEKMMQSSGNQIYMFDLNDDDVQDTFYIIPPQSCIDENEMETGNNEGPCISKIVFSGNIPPLFVEHSIGGDIKILDDINENGYREIAFFPYWFQSCWSRIDIYSFNKPENQWKLIQSVDYNCCDETIPTTFQKNDKHQLTITTNGDMTDDSNTASADSSLQIWGLGEKRYQIFIP